MVLYYLFVKVKFGKLAFLELLQSYMASLLYNFDEF